MQFLSIATQRSSITILIITLNTLITWGQSSPYSTLQNVAPPSPEAISFVKQNFTDVSLYTGKINYSIPVYTLSQNGISFPISLSYSGGGGIKVEEVASSVGLGWSLQSTGVITRSVKGRPDDVNTGSFIGYMHLPGFDSTLNPTTQSFDLYKMNYSDGHYDAQPDLHFINAPGLSGSFYINKLKEIVFVEKSDLRVKVLFSGFSITGFEVTDTNGTTYVFDVTETNKSIALVAPNPTEYNLYDVSSWYLSKIVNEHGKTIFRFVYQNKDLNQTKQLIRSPYQYTLESQFQFDEDNSTYTELYNRRPVLEKILSATGEVRFVKSTTNRYDLAGDKSIDSIIVKNNEGKLIRKFNFDYSYFSPTGTVQQGSQHFTDGDPSLRLKLDRFEVIAGSDPSIKETYSFVYNTSTLLPNRLTSFAMDHWGYYNGISNSTWEGKHRVKYYTLDGFGSYKSTSTEYGTANREPDPLFAQACILTEVITPTGGSHQFEYEGHTSNHPDLPNQVTTAISEYTLDEQKNYFTVDLIREPFAYVTVKAFVETGFTIEYTVSDSAQTQLPIIDTLTAGSSQHIHKLEKGKYYIKAKLVGSHPDPSFNYGPRLIKENETLILNKPVGGVRIKQMKMVDPVTGQNLTRNYYYNEAGSANEISPSTGIVGGVPAYGYQYIELQGSDYIPNYYSVYHAIPKGYVRQLSSTYPLITTNGSYTGYNKVTTIDSDQLKSEYYFTSFNEFPEVADGFYTAAFTDGGAIYQGTWYEILPFVPNDERDHLRGKLKKEVHYKKEGLTFKKDREKENIYSHNFGTLVSKHQLVLPDVYESVTGVIFSGSRKKSYRLHTSKYDLQKTIEKNYSYNDSQVDSLVTETELEYGHTPWFKQANFHYQVTKVVQQKGVDTDTSSYYYPYDWRYANPDIAIADTAFLRKLEKQNRIGMPVIEKKKRNNTHISTLKNLYANFNSDQLNPSVIQLKRGWENSFTNEIYFNKYDTIGNILEQQKANDFKALYLWDKNSFPVAQITNAENAHVAYTSFEDGSKGNWTFSGAGVTDTTSPTGKRRYMLGGSITKSGLSTSGTYIVSYWKNSGTVNVNGTTPTTGNTVNGWTYYEHKVVNPAGGLITVSGTSGIIDELRLYPLSAQMTTYTYEPMIGVTTSCDTNNIITYYIYDAFGRLTLIKDSNKNVLKQVKYNYQTSQQQPQQ
jgi:hypothetical protein